MNFHKAWLIVLCLALAGDAICSGEVLRYHTLVVDGQNKIIPWSTPTTNAFDYYLDKCWSWALAAPNDANGLPISFLYCAWIPGNPPRADTSYENDVGEKIPHWVESARLYYQYTGDMAPLDYVKRLVDYSLDHGQTPTNHAWPSFPVGTANAGDTEFRGFTQRWALWDCHVDLAAHIGFSLCRMYQIYGDTKYRDKAIHVADLLASHIVAGSATDSPWPYVVNSQTGATKSRYAASWTGALQLFDFLIDGNQGNVSSYTNARSTLKNWLLTYPMQNGNWVDGHSDVVINGNNNWSTTCASDMCLYLLAHPSWDTNFMTDVPRLLKWAEDNFVNVSTPDGLSGQYHGAYVPAEQNAYMYRMGYQTARIGAQYAQWYAVSGDPTYKDRAYRCLSYNTYMMQTNGQSSDGPTDTVGWWWSDCYGEATIMYYFGLAAVPEWAPADQNHLLYSSSVVKTVNYATNAISYMTFDSASTETLRLAFTPMDVFVNGTPLPQRGDLTQPGWVFNASNGVLRLRHDTGTNVQIVAGTPTVTLTNGIPSQNQNNGVALIEDCYRYTAVNPVARLQFEILGPTADLTLVVRKGLPQPGLGLFDYISANPGTNDEFILVLTNSFPVFASAGDWYLTAINRSGAAANYAIQATQWATSGQPITLVPVSIQGDSFCFSWNSLPGARYVVQGKVLLTDPDWVHVSSTITANGVTTGHCEPLPSPCQFFRVAVGVAVD